MPLSPLLEPVEIVINGVNYAYQRLVVDLSPLALPEWLRNQTLFPKVYWKAKGGKEEVAAVGSLLQFNGIPRTEHPTLRFFGGQHFQKGKKGVEWSDFPSALYWLPQFELIQKEERTCLVIHFLNREADPSAMQALNFESSSHSSAFSMLIRRDFPTHEPWKNGVLRALDQIEQKAFEKVVLARKTQFLCDLRIDPWHILKKLQEQAHAETLFAFSLSEKSAFIGATPEFLYRRTGSSIQVDALAGTRARQYAEIDPMPQKWELANSPKEQREFGCVKTCIDEALTPLSEEMEWEGSETIIETGNLLHLHHLLKAQLKKTVSDQELIQTLHPTPALGGAPRSSALTFINEWEPFARGWYGSPVGWVSQQQAEIAVAIRSALIRDREIDLFAGTGIVAGSHPDREWEELEHKISRFKRILLEQ